MHLALLFPNKWSITLLMEWKKEAGFLIPESLLSLPLLLYIPSKCLPRMGYFKKIGTMDVALTSVVVSESFSIEALVTFECEKIINSIKQVSMELNTIATKLSRDYGIYKAIHSGLTVLLALLVGAGLLLLWPPSLMYSWAKALWLSHTHILFLQAKHM